GVPSGELSTGESVLGASRGGGEGPSSAHDATDLAAGLRLAADLLPSDYRPRVVLLSDGQETTGDAVAQARLLNARGVEVDVVPLPSASGPEALVDSVSTPNVV